MLKFSLANWENPLKRTYILCYKSCEKLYQVLQVICVLYVWTCNKMESFVCLTTTILTYNTWLLPLALLHVLFTHNNTDSKNSCKFLAGIAWYCGDIQRILLTIVSKWSMKTVLNPTENFSRFPPNSNALCLSMRVSDNFSQGGGLGLPQSTSLQLSEGIEKEHYLPSLSTHIILLD